MNYSDKNIKYIRIHEFKHLHPEKKVFGETIIMKEYPKTNNLDPYYQIRREVDNLLYNKYLKLVKKEKNIIFGGRLASYRYFDMHQVIGSALSTFNTLK